MNEPTVLLNEKSPFLAQKARFLREQLDKKSTREPLKIKAYQLRHPVAQLLRDVQQWYVQLLNKRIQIAQDHVSNTSKKQAWTEHLQYSDNKKELVLVNLVAAVTSGILGWFIHPMIILLPLIASILYSAWFIQRKQKDAKDFYEEQLRKPKLRALDRLKDIDFVALQFADHQSDIFTYDYQCTMIQEPQREPILQVWKLDSQKYGKLYGQCFIGLLPKNDPAPQIRVLLRFDVRGLDPIELYPGALNTYNDILSELAAYLFTKKEQWIEHLSALTMAIDEGGDGHKEEEHLRKELHYIAQQEQQLRHIGIPPQTLDGILSHLEGLEQGTPISARGILLYGPSGVGKTIIAQTTAKAMGLNLLNIDIAEATMNGKGAVSQYIKSMFKRAALMPPCAMILDDCDRVLGSNVSDDVAQEFQDTFLAQWDVAQKTPGKLIVIGTTQHRDVINTDAMLRFNHIAAIELPDASVRKTILMHAFEEHKVALAVSEALVKETAGMSGRELQQIAMRLKNNAAHQNLDQPLVQEVIKSLRTRSSVSTQSVDWSQVVLPVELKNKLVYLTKKIKNIEEYTKIGMPVNKSLLLYGPPGTGKTHIARALATESGLTFLAASTADVKSVVPGESARYIKQLFQRARSQSPCLLFIDEIDIIAMVRTAGDPVGQEIVGQFLQEMDGINTRDSAGQVFVIGATNNREQIDRALLSRFSDQEEVALPTEDARKDIVAVLMTKKPIEGDRDALCIAVANATPGFSGRDLQSLVNAAASRAMQRADEQHLDLTDIRVGLFDFDGLNVQGRTIRVQ